MNEKVLGFLPLNDVGYFDCLDAEESHFCVLAIRNLHPKGSKFNKIEFSINESDYAENGLHFHIFSAERMHYYIKFTGETPDGVDFIVPDQSAGRWTKWWYKDNWFDDFFLNHAKEMCVECYVKDYLIASP